jgi:ABC-type branched-subunit amino acid transport system substrate-binding protein
MRWLEAFAVSGFVIALGSASAVAQKKYDVGVTDSEIKIGNVMPYSGPGSAYAAIGKTEAAYFKMINDQGGINGRKINFISYDDSYNPPKTVEQVRRLAESDEVYVLFNIVGTAGNSAVQKYLNQKKIPHIFISSGAARFDDPEHYPWSMAWWPGFKKRSPHLCEIYPRALSQQNDRDPVSERRFRKRLPRGFPRSAWTGRIEKNNGGTAL